jgi:hypothetical protein
MNRIVRLVLSLILAGVPASAAEMCSFVSEELGGLLESGGSTGRILFDGLRYRVEFDPEEEPRGFDVLVSKDGGKRQHGIDLKNRSWYTLDPVDPSIPSNPLLGLLPVWNEKKSVKNVELAVVEKPEPEMVSGRSTRRHEVRLSYDVRIEFPGESIEGQVRLEAVFWMVGDGAFAVPVLLRPEIRTGFAEIDSRLDEALAKLQGLPIKREVNIVAEAKRTLPRTSQATVVLSDCKPVQAKAAQFEVPNGFKYEKPVLMAPGAPSFSPPPSPPGSR